MLNCDNDVTKSVNALSVSAPVGLQGSVANLSQSSDALVDSQANYDQCEPVDHANVCASSNTDIKNNKSETCSDEISLNDLLHPPDAVFLNYSDAELDINCDL